MQWPVLLLAQGQEIRAEKKGIGNYIQDIAIVRIEQIAPFPHEQLKKVLSAYGSNVDYYWAQEEHENYGAWNFLYPRLNLLLGKKVNFFGRSSSAATAVGMLKVHKKENAALLEEIFA